MAIRKRGKRYEVDVYVKVNGKRKRTFEYFDKQHDARDRDAEIRREKQIGTHTNIKKTVAQYAAQLIADWERRGLERCTIHSRQVAIKLHIIPRIGPDILNKMQVPDITSFYEGLTAGKQPPAGDKKFRSRFAGLLTCKNVDPAKREAARKELRSYALTPSHAREVLATLSMLFNYAIRIGEFKRVNPCSKVLPKKHARESRGQKLQIGVDVPTIEEVLRLRDALTDDSFYKFNSPKFGRQRLPVLTAILTGLRLGELRGLPWSDVDLDRGEITVTQRADAYKVIGVPKSDSGYLRKIPLPPELVRRLRTWKKDCPVGDANLVFPGRHGEVQNHSNITVSGLNPALIRAGLATVIRNPDGSVKRNKRGNAMYRYKYQMHKLRHFYASWCFSAKDRGGLGLRIEDVSKAMGHSTIAITHDLYGHMLPSRDTSKQFEGNELVTPRSEGYQPSA